MAVAWLWHMEIGWGVLCWFSMAIYALFLITIVRKRKEIPFNSHFFTICRALAVYDVGIIIALYAYRVVDRANVLLSVTVRLLGHRLVTPLIFYCQTAEHFSLLLLALNRLTGVVYPMKDKQFWNRWLKRALTVNALWPLLFSVPLVFVTKYNFRTQWHNESTRNIVIVEPTANAPFIGLTVLWMMLVNLVCSVVYTITVVHLIRHRGDNRTSTRKAEIKLTIGGLLLFLMLMMYAAALVYAVYTQANRETNPEAFEVAEFLITAFGELYAFVNPYLILACSTKAYKAFVITCRGLFCQPNASQNTMTTSRSRH